MKTIELELGKKVQRKGSSVIWTIDTINDSYPDWKNGEIIGSRPVTYKTMVRLECMPKNRKYPMHEWLDLEQFNRNWREV